MHNKHKKPCSKVPTNLLSGPIVACVIIILHLVITSCAAILTINYRTGWLKYNMNTTLYLVLVAAGTITSMTLILITYRSMRKLQQWQPLHKYFRELAETKDSTAQATLEQIKPLPAGNTLPEVTRGWNRILEILDQLHEQLEITQAETGLGQFLCNFDSQRLLGVIDTLPDGIILSDSQGNILLVNRRCQGKLGKTVSNLMSCNIVELFTDNQARQTIDNFLKNTNSSSEAHFEIIIHNHHPVDTSKDQDTEDQYRPDSKYLQETILSITCMRLSSDLDCSDIFLILRDVTQQKMVLASQNDFIAHVSHELRNPLTNIRAYAETLISDMVIDVSTQKEAFNVINEETIRLTRLVNEVLDLTRMEIGSLTCTKNEVNTDKLIRQCVADVQAVATTKKITLHTHYHPKLPNLNADRDRLAVAFHNILSNAIKYTPDEGSVFVESSVDENHVYIKVSDTGLGIAKDDMSRIFDKFYRVDRPETAHIQGSGLGLSTAREIINQHNGHININSEMDKGTQITIILPIQMVGPTLGPSSKANHNN